MIYLPLSEIVYFTEKVTFRPSSGNEMPSSSLCSYFGSYDFYQLSTTDVEASTGRDI